MADELPARGDLLPGEGQATGPAPAARRLWDRNTISCKCGWRRIVPMVGRGAPFGDAARAHFYEHRAEPEGDHATSYPEEDVEGTEEVTPAELAIGAAWFDGYYRGWTDAAKKAVEVIGREMR